MAKKLFTEDLLVEIDRLRTLFTDHYRPACPFEFEQVAIMGRAGAQLERLQKLRVADMQRVMDRAELFFDADRPVTVEKLASRISRDPSRIAGELAQTKQGAEWLIGVLMGLLRIWRSDQIWNERQCRLASDALGIRIELRSQGEVSEAEARSLAERAEAEIQRLEEDLESHLIALDAGAQAMAMAGMPGAPDLETKQHRKYESTVRREYELARAALLASQARSLAEAVDPSAEVQQPPVASHRGPDRWSDPEPDFKWEDEADSEPAAEAPEVEESGLEVVEDTPGVEPVAVDEPAAAQAQAARVIPSVSKAAAVNDYQARQRRRAMQKAARKAARRKGR